MRRALMAILVGLLVGALAPTAIAAEHEDGTYLALGDSVAAGTQRPPLFTNRGYTNRLFKWLESEAGFDEFVNLSCPGDDTAEMLDGNASDGSICYGDGAFFPPGGPSQLDAAVAYLLAHPGEVELITITIGANDVLACSLDLPPDELEACLIAQLGQIGANLPVIVGTLQAVAPGVPIVAMNYYNPNLAFWLDNQSDDFIAQQLVFTDLFNGTLEAVYGFFGVPVADVETAFRTFRTRGTVPANVRAACNLTQMCERAGGEFALVDWNPLEPGVQADIHPSNRGYRVIKNAFVKTIEAGGVLD